MNEDRISKKQIEPAKSITLTTLGWELAIPIFVGLFVGIQIDRVFHTHYVFTISCVLIGILAGYYSLYKLIELEILRNKYAKTHRKVEK